MTSPTGPLAGLVVRPPDPPDTRSGAGHKSRTVAAAINGVVNGTVTATLARLGATFDDSATDAAVAPLVWADDAQDAAGELEDVDGLPEGTLAYATGLAASAATILQALTGTSVSVDPRCVANHLLLPVVMAASYGTQHRQPPEPVAIGGGFVACDFAGDDDRAAFDRLLDSLGADANDPVAVADEAQRWRLPVCAFTPDPRPSVRSTPGSSSGTATALGDQGTLGPRWEPMPGGAPLAGLVVGDLTAMWAGPLTTFLLASLGADVRKIEPAFRLDGMRAGDGSGIHPPDVDPSGGDASAMFNALNRGKHVVDLDLREPEHRQRFESIVSASDIVIDNFSRRVMPNLGYAHAQLAAIRSTVITVSMPAFPVDHLWQVALGPGVHAASGLGSFANGIVAAPCVAYPDPLTGLTAFAETLAAVWALVQGRARGAQHRDVPMLEAVTPLLSLRTGQRRVARRDLTLGSRLLDHSAMRSAWEDVTDGAGTHPYPRSPFVGPWPSVALTPAAAHPATGQLGDASPRPATMDQR